MGGSLGSLQGIVKLITFILVTVAFALGLFIHKFIGGTVNAMIQAVFGGFFGYYLGAFIGFLLGSEVDTNVASTWSIYAACSLLTAGISALTLIPYYGGKDGEVAMCKTSGVMAILAAVSAFFEAVLATN